MLLALPASEQVLHSVAESLHHFPRSFHASAADLSRSFGHSPAVHLKGVQEDELSSLSEAFITGTSRAVLPVTMINHQPVGDGKPGPISKKLLEVYMSRIDRIAEDI